MCSYMCLVFLADSGYYDTQLHSTTKTIQYKVIFVIKPSSEPVPILKIVEESANEDGAEFSDSSSD